MWKPLPYVYPHTLNKKLINENNLNCQKYLDKADNTHIYTETFMSAICRIFPIYSSKNFNINKKAF